MCTAVTDRRKDDDDDDDVASARATIATNRIDFWAGPQTVVQRRRRRRSTRTFLYIIQLTHARA